MSKTLHSELIRTGFDEGKTLHSELIGSGFDSKEYIWL